MGQQVGAPMSKAMAVKEALEGILSIPARSDAIAQIVLIVAIIVGGTGIETVCALILLLRAIGRVFSGK